MIFCRNFASRIYQGKIFIKIELFSLSSWERVGVRLIKICLMQKISYMKKTLFITLIISLSSLFANAAEMDSTKVYNLEGIEVVSTPKEKGAMRQQPSAVSLISNQQLTDNHIVSLKGISALVPNFFMPDYGSRLTSAVYIRGIGSRMNTPAVGLYVDNIPYVDKSAFDFNFYDIERVDVLRGPQGTLYGRNAMGGIIKVHTRNPFLYNGTDANMSFATGDNHGRISLNHYGKLNENFAISVGGYAEKSNGFFKNSFTGKRVDGVTAAGGRFRGILIPSEVLKVDYSISYDYSDEGAYPYYYNGTQGKTIQDDPYPECLGKITNNRKSSYRRNMFNGGLNLEYNAEKFVLNAVTGYQNITDRMFLDQDFISADIYTLEQKQRINTFSEELTMKSKNQGFWEWINGANIMYQALNTTGPVTFFEDGINWLTQMINSQMPNPAEIPSMARMGFKTMGVNFREKEIHMGGTFDTPTLNAALFHQSTLHFNDKLSAVVGLRFDYDHHQMDYNAPANVPYGFALTNENSPMMAINLQQLNANLLYEGNMKHDYLQLLPKVALRYEFNKNNNVYASLSKGMRSGGYNVQMFSDLLEGALRNSMMSGVKEGVNSYLDKMVQYGMPEQVLAGVKQAVTGSIPDVEAPSVDGVVYKPEYSWNYEVGTHLSFPEAKLLLDGAVFYVDTRDQQIARFAESGFGRMMVNAGKSESFGAEMSLKWNPLEALALMANYGYTHTTFKEYDGGSVGGEKIDYSGNYVPFVPMHTVNLDAAYTFNITSSFLKALTVGANYTGNGKMYWTEDNTMSQDFYSLLGARLTFESKIATMSLWAKNITNTKYNTFSFISASRCFEQHGKPFQIGIDLKLHF